MGGKGSGARPRKARVVPMSMVKPRCPRWLDKRGKVEWKRLVDILDRVPELCCEPDWDAVALLAAAWSEYHAADAVVKKEGAIHKAQSGALYQHPAVGQRNKAFERIHKMTRELAMTPQSRRLLNGVKPKKDEKVNPLTEYLNRRSLNSG